VITWKLKVENDEDDDGGGICNFVMGMISIAFVTVFVTFKRKQ